jgi:hypothetical protein
MRQCQRGKRSSLPEAMSSLEVDSQQLLRADNAVRAQKGVCLKVSNKAATGFIAAGTVAAFLIGLAIGFGCVQRTEQRTLPQAKAPARGCSESRSVS